MTQTQIIVGLGVVVTLLWGLSLLLVKKQITDVFETVKRLPPQKWFDDLNMRVQELPGRQWFDEVHRSLKVLPDPERLAEHFKMVHKLSNDLHVALLRLSDLKAEHLDLKEAQQRDRDHVAKIDDRVARNEGRLDRIDGEKAEDRRGPKG